MKQVNSTYLKNIFGQMVRFGASGGATVLADYLSFSLLYAAGAPLFVATLASLLAGFVVSFTLNRQWVFHADATHAQKKMTMQLLLYALLLTINIVITYFFIRYMQNMGVDPYLAKIFSIGLIMSWNFVLYKKVIFRLRQPARQLIE